MAYQCQACEHYFVKRHDKPCLDCRFLTIKVYYADEMWRDLNREIIIETSL